MFKSHATIVKAMLFFLVSSALFVPLANAQQNNFSLTSKIFQETREIVVHLPENYNPESKEGYPVFYMLDAEQETDEIAAQPIANAPEVIVIAIHNVRRGMDFLPHHTSVKRDEKQVFGNGRKFLSFLKDELMPLVQKKFRTNGQRFFHGHSWAGQYVTYALSEAPELFDAFFITSPSIGRYGDKTFSNLKRVFKQELDFPAFVYVSVGGNERPRLKTDYDQLTTLLKLHLPSQVKLVYEINEGAIHDNSGGISIPKAMKIYFSITASQPMGSPNQSRKKAHKAKYPNIDNRYFGEKPPGLQAILFAPDILSPEGSFEGGNFTPDMKEFYFTRKNGPYKKRTFFVIRFENNQWGQESETDIKWPQFSKDGKTMYLGKKYRERTANGWSDVKRQGAFLKNQAHGLSVSANGTYYFAVYKKEDMNTNGALYYCSSEGGEYKKLVKMNAEINTGTYIAHPFIAPDESYLIWDVRREGGYGQADLFISFKQKNGTWGKTLNMGSEINTGYQESAPRVTHDGKYLFFTRGEWKPKKEGGTYYVGKRYWVDAKIIENLRIKQ